MANNLELYYPGDEAWAAFVAVILDNVSMNDPENKLLAALHGHKDIAQVVNNTLGSWAIQWVVELIPALDGLTPAECTLTPAGLKRLKTMLMRMPR